MSTGTGERIEIEALKHGWGPNAEQAKRRLCDATYRDLRNRQSRRRRVESGERRDSRGLDIEFNVKVPLTRPSTCAPRQATLE